MARPESTKFDDTAPKVGLVASRRQEETHVFGRKFDIGLRADFVVPNHSSDDGNGFDHINVAPARAKKQ